MSRQPKTVGWCGGHLQKDRPEDYCDLTNCSKDKQVLPSKYHEAGNDTSK